MGARFRVRVGQQYRWKGMVILEELESSIWELWAQASCKAYPWECGGLMVYLMVCRGSPVCKMLTSWGGGGGSLWFRTCNCLIWKCSCSVSQRAPCQNLGIQDLAFSDYSAECSRRTPQAMLHNWRVSAKCLPWHALIQGTGKAFGTWSPNGCGGGRWLCHLPPIGHRD